MASTVGEITRLISKLSLRPLEAETSELVNVNELIMETLGSRKIAFGCPARQGGEEKGLLPEAAPIL